MRLTQCLVLIITLEAFYTTSCHCMSSNENDIKQKRSLEVEVRSVFLNCEIDDSNEISANSEVARFQREELFKHNSLRNCKQKLAVTVKMCNDPEQSAADEYIPIEHVLGANNKRIRLLNPYILRLRREPPYQVYKLQKIDTVTGVLSSSKGEYKKNQIKRNQSKNNFKHDDNTTRFNLHDRNAYPLTEKESQIFRYNAPLDELYENPTFRNNDDEDETSEVKRLPATESRHFSDIGLIHDSDELSTNSIQIIKNKIRKDEDIYSSTDLSVGNGNKAPMKLKNSNTFSKRYDLPSLQRDFVLYEIGDPDLWYKAQVQLYEKISKLDGKSMWNDFTKLVPASISAMDPEWSNQDLTIRYRTKDFVARENFSLPSGSLCLVLPLNYTKENMLKNRNAAKYGEFIIVPIDDIIMIKSDKMNHDVHALHGSSTSNNQQRRRRVVIRTTRTLMAGSIANLGILDHGSERYLMLPQRSSHRAQLDLEAKADDNKLIVAGSSGRLTSIVSDTRKTRSTLTLQVTNTGLAAAYYKVSVRECSPRLSEFYENDSSDGLSTKSLIPPMHSKTFQLELPLDSSSVDALCSVTLMNDEDESVAARDVRVKRNDRCFCIWHCECVCIDEDPKLICRNMPDAQLTAAGLSSREGPRHIRSVCYPDIITLNLFVIFVGVLLALLILGLCLRCVGSWGLQLLLHSPRKVAHYYENSLRCRTVVYDKDGWPIHPDTKQRTVRLVSKSMEFLLNTIFFIILPCILLWDAMKDITNKCQTTDKHTGSNSKSNPKKCFSTHDMQCKELRWRRHKEGLVRKWMTPQAQDLSTDIWQYGLPGGRKVNDCMQPLLNETPFRGKLDKTPHIDSEQDDTEFVLMQMQKSKESLAKSHEILKEPESDTCEKPEIRNHWKKNIDVESTKLK